MQLPIMSGHLEDDVLEQYALNRLVGANLDTVDDHLLVCQACQIRVAEFDEYVAATRPALRSLRVKKAGLPPFLRNVFISHGGPSITHVEAVCELLEVLDLTPVVSIYMPNLGLSIHDKVRKCMRICSSAVVLATPDDDEEVASQTRRTRPNVEHEIGMLQTMPNIGNRIVYMKDPKVESPSNYREKCWIPFDKDRASESFVALIKELRAFAL